MVQRAVSLLDALQGLSRFVGTKIEERRLELICLVGILAASAVNAGAAYVWATGTPKPGVDTMLLQFVQGGLMLFLFKRLGHPTSALPTWLPVGWAFGTTIGCGLAGFFIDQGWLLGTHANAAATALHTALWGASVVLIYWLPKEIQALVWGLFTLWGRLNSNEPPPAVPLTAK
jgi:hypothetical protein